MRTKSFSVFIDKKVLKGISKLPLKIQKKLNLLVKDLRDIGPIRILSKNTGRRHF